MSLTAESKSVASSAPLSRGPNSELIGIPGSRWRLATPALVIDLDALEHNIATMASWSVNHGVKLRPHAKTHKSAAIARLQLDAGAVGICVAKPSEAERLVELGVGKILVTSPIVTDTAIERVLDLNEKAEELQIVVDNLAVVAKLGEVAVRRHKPLCVLVDIGMGRNRTGVAIPGQAGELALAIGRHRGLKLRGLQAYAGHIQHIVGYAERLAAARDALARIREARDAMAAVGHTPDIVTGGGTGSYDIDGDAAVFTDLEVGSYVFMDVQYNEVIRKDGTAGPFRTSLYVQATVISANKAGQATTDAGFKAFATDGPKPVIATGAPSGSEYVFMGDEHGCVMLPKGANGLEVGSVVTCATPHCDPTVNLFDYYHCVRGDTLVDIWPVDTRGRTW